MPELPHSSVTVYIHYVHSYMSGILIIRFVITVWNGRRSKQALLGYIRKLLARPGSDAVPFMSRT